MELDRVINENNKLDKENDKQAEDYVKLKQGICQLVVKFQVLLSFCDPPTQVF